MLYTFNVLSVKLLRLFNQSKLSIMFYVASEGCGTYSIVLSGKRYCSRVIKTFCHFRSGRVTCTCDKRNCYSKDCVLNLVWVTSFHCTQGQIESLKTFYIRYSHPYPTTASSPSSWYKLTFQPSLTLLSFYTGEYGDYLHYHITYTLRL